MRTSGLAFCALLAACAAAAPPLREPVVPAPTGELALEATAVVIPPIYAERTYIRVSYTITNVSSAPATVIGEPIGPYRDAHRATMDLEPHGPLLVELGGNEGRGCFNLNPPKSIVLAPGESVSGSYELDISKQGGRIAIERGVIFSARIGVIEGIYVVSERTFAAKLVHATLL